MRDTIVIDNFSDWASEGAFSKTEQPGRWCVLLGRYGATKGEVLYTPAGAHAPTLSVNPEVAGWHDVRVRIYHGRYAVNDQGYGLYMRSSRDPAFRILNMESDQECFEELYLGARDLTDARMEIANFGRQCFIDCVRLTPTSDAERARRNRWREEPAEKEGAGIVDFADAASDYLPDEACAAECARVHGEAGFTTVYWKAYAVRCEYHTQVGEVRSAKATGKLGTLLEQYDTLTTAVEAAHEVGLKIDGWMRISNEFDAPSGEWSKFAPTTPFHLAHPGARMRSKDGRVQPKLSFAYPEVREHKIAIAREILEHGVDGLMIDVHRHPPMVMWDLPLVEAFIQETGEDPRQMEGDGTEAWLRFRARVFTTFLCELREMMATPGFEDKTLTVRTHPWPWKCLRDGCDVAAWVDQGVVDAIIASPHCGMPDGFPTVFDLGPMVQLTQGKVRLLANVWRMGVLHYAFALARQVYDQGADGVTLYESNFLITQSDKRERVWSLRFPQIGG